MDNLNLYEKFYFREIDRKHYLNNSYGFPILILSSIISLSTYFLTKQYGNCLKSFTDFLFISILISVLIAIYYLIKSFSNFHKTIVYKEITDMNRILKYENDLIQEQKKFKKAEILFNDYMKKEYADCATHNFRINKTRTEDIAKAKIAIFVSVTLTIVFSIIYIIKFL